MNVCALDALERRSKKTLVKAEHFKKAGSKDAATVHVSPWMPTRAPLTPRTARCVRQQKVTAGTRDERHLLFILRRC